MKNKLIVIGFLGQLSCYLNVTREEAIIRYERDNYKLEGNEYWLSIEEIEFDDELGAYDIWKN